MAKIVFVHPLFLADNPVEEDLASPYFPLGLLYLASYVREAGHEVAIYDATFEPDASTFGPMLADVRPDIIGISALQPSRTAALTLAHIGAATGAVIVLGGPDPTAAPARYLTDEAVDVVVHHEGEQTITRLLDLIDAGALTLDSLASEPGVAYRGDGQPIVNQPRPPIDNLDSLPLPARDLIDMDRYLQVWDEANGYSSMTIATTRGCPYRCEWCRDAVHGAGFRQRSPESVAAEMKILKETYDISRLRMIDDVDGIERHWLEAWATAAGDLDAVIPFEALNDLSRSDIPLLDVRDSL